MQFQQVIDAFLLALALFAAHAPRYYGTGWFDLPCPIDPFRNYQWLLIMIIPFGPTLLDLERFCESPFNRNVREIVLPASCGG